MLAWRGRVSFAVPPEALAGGGESQRSHLPSHAAVAALASCKHNTSLRSRADCCFNRVKSKVGGGELRIALFDELVCFPLTREG